MKSHLDRRGALVAGLVLAAGVPMASLLLACRRREEASRAGLGKAGTDPGRRLVVIELTGGADGLSTVVPYADDAYHRLRPTLRLTGEEVLRIDGRLGFAPALQRLRARYDAGEVAVVEGAGYPDPFYSHFRAFEVWHTARREGRASGEGWLGRLRGAAFPGDARNELLVHVGPEVPYSVVCPERPALCFADPAGLRWRGGEGLDESMRAAADPGLVAHDEDAAMEPSVLDLLRTGLGTAQQASERVRRTAEEYRPRVEYPATPLGQALQTVAALLQSDVGTRILSVQQGNYDTHGGSMRHKHARLLGVLDAALDAFLTDLRGSDAGKGTVVLVYSEFGRRAAENESRGTDHGAAGPMFVIAPEVRGGIHGATPSLTELDPEGNPVHTIDFRRVYAALVERCFGVPNERVLPERFEPLPLWA